MGKGTIVSGGTDGLYTVDFDYGSTRVDQIIAFLQENIAIFEQAIIDAQEDAEASGISETAALLALNNAIAAYTVDKSSENKKALKEATELSAKAGISSTAYRRRVSTLTYQKLSYEARLASLEKIDTSERDQIWCVDLTEDATGEVGTIEINGEGPEKLIAPGGRLPESSDGIMTARGIQSPEQLFLNAAILPGWQKFSPTYRTGVISNIDYENDTGDVALDTARSSAQSLGINQSTSLTAVPIEYMQCNATAFDDGDEVVVQFVEQSWDNPKVIGFVSNPKSCGPAELSFLVDDNGLSRDVPGTYDKRLGEAGATNSTTPSAGLSVDATTYEATWGNNAFHADDEEFHIRKRIRFDYAFRRIKISDPYFETVERTDYEAQTLGLSYDMNCIAAPDIRVDGSGAPVRVTVRNLSPETILDEFNIERTVYTGTITISAYVFSEINESEPLNYIVADPAYSTAWLAGYYSAPAEITMIIEEKPIDYVLQSFGPPPQLNSVDRTYAVPNTPGGGGIIDNQKIYNMMCVTYRRKNIA